MPNESDDLSRSESNAGGSFSKEINQSVTPISIPDELPSENAGGVLRPYVNELLNSRLTSSIPEGRWTVRWQADLLEGLQPSFLLNLDNRSLVQGRDYWQLFDRTGTAAMYDRTGNGDVIIDPSKRLFYSAMPNGMMAANNLTDGSSAYKVNLIFGRAFRRDFMALREQRIIVASTEQKVDLHEPGDPDYSMVEIHDLGNPVATDDLGILVSSQLVVSLERETSLLVAALHNETLILATPGLIEISDLNLNIRGSLTGNFQPLSLSMDESGRMYMIVQTTGDEAKEHPSLWVLTQSGERVVDVEIPILPGMAYTPPVVSYDHQAYILLEDRVLAITSSGELDWNQHMGGQIAGAVVTTDNQLLVAAGRFLFSFSPTGERTVLFQLEDGRWMTPPILTERNRLQIASDRQLYCLELIP